MAILKRRDEVVEARHAWRFQSSGSGARGCFVISVFSRCQGAMALKHVYDHDAFHAFLQRLDPKLCRTGMCMG